MHARSSPLDPTALDSTAPAPETADPGVAAASRGGSTPQHARFVPEQVFVPERQLIPEQVRPHALRLARRRCLVIPVADGRRPLARALRELLATELPDLDLVFRDHGERFDAVWVCGAGADAEPCVRLLRERHERALLVVTGRGLHSDHDGLLVAGADRVLGWPSSVDELREAFQ